MSYVVKTDEFEGPLELLLSLIEKRKLLINDLSLSRVTEGYVEHIRGVSEDRAQEISEFLVVAATLMLIKSKSLLPNLDLSYEEEAQIDDLEERLYLYKQLRSVAVHIERVFACTPLFERQGRYENSKPLFASSSDMDIASLQKAANDLIRGFPRKERHPTARVEKTISLDEVIEGLRERIGAGLSTTFNDIVGEKRGARTSVIVHFLALLELVKQGIASARQAENGDITIESNQVQTPNYQ